MKSKAPLSLMEQVIMILVFSLASAICLQGFSVANRISHSQENRNQAALVAQNYAELLKYHSGDYETADLSSSGYWDNFSYHISYDDTWTATTKKATYSLVATPLESDNNLLGNAKIQVCSGRHILFEIDIAWQEVVTDETK